MTKETTESVRIDKEILEKVRFISKSKGQTLSGYINVNMRKIVEREWLKVNNNAKKNTV